MKILNLDRQMADIEFSLDYLKVIENSFVGICNQLTDNDFASIIWDISKEEAIEFTQTISIIIEKSLKNSFVLPTNPFIESLFKADNNKVVLRMPYRSIMGLYSILNEVYFGVYFKIADFEREIGITKTQFDSFLLFILHDIIEKMQEGSPSKLIYDRRKNVVQKINFNRDLLKKELLTSPIEKECILKLTVTQVFFFINEFKKEIQYF